jgi:hypothetical protein
MNIERRIEKLEAQQDQGDKVFVWWRLDETKEQALARFRRERPGVLEQAGAVSLVTWIRADEGIGAAA